MTVIRKIPVEPLTRAAYAPFGWVIGGEPPTHDPELAWSGPASVFWHEGSFDPGEGGEIQFLWVQYKWQPIALKSLESHRLTEQSVIPVNGTALIQVVCPPPANPLATDNQPDLSQIRAFLFDGSAGVRMKQGTWHWQYPLADPARYLMVTRRSSTSEIPAMKHRGTTPVETIIVSLSDLTSDKFELVF